MWRREMFVIYNFDYKKLYILLNNLNIIIINIIINIINNLNIIIK